MNIKVTQSPTLIYTDLITLSPLRDTSKYPRQKDDQDEINIIKSSGFTSSPILVKEITQPDPSKPRYVLLRNERIWYAAQACQLDQVLCQVIPLEQSQQMSEKDEIQLIESDLKSQSAFTTKLNPIEALRYE